MAYQKVAQDDAPPATETARVLVSGPTSTVSGDDESFLSDTATLIRAGAQAVQGVRQSVRRISTKLGPLT